ncbi:MAG: hypothetical protein EBT45_05970 [Alphaproteobacteria bacterium]|nr:hypothetical protein [Alphaproteobacteria bacterium]
MMKKNSSKKQQNQVMLTQNLHRGAVSFWGYETKEDRIARNLWIYLMIGLATFSCLVFYLNIFNT